PVLHQGNAAIDRGRDREVLIGDSPEHRRPDGGLGLSFIEARHLAITVQHQGKTVPWATLPAPHREATSAWAMSRIVSDRLQTRRVALSSREEASTTMK